MWDAKDATVVVCPFEFAANDPLREEHALVTAWVRDAHRSIDRYSNYQQVDLKSTPAGQEINRATGESARRIIMAALAQLRHWDQQAQRVRDQGKTEVERINAHLFPQWPDAWGPRRQTSVVLFALMRRALPFTETDLLAFCTWLLELDGINTYRVPVGAFVKAIERFAKSNPVSDELRAALRQCAQAFRVSTNKAVQRSATVIEQVAGVETIVSEAAPASIRPLTPTPSGSPVILVQLKQYLGLLPNDEVARAEIAPDQFQLRSDSPLAAEHAELTAVFEAIVGTRGYDSVDLDAMESEGITSA